MNFLGHLYFSPNNWELRIANLFGDFVKGSDLSEYPKIIQEGILLHRSIDSYIDNHPAVIELLHKLYPYLPKVSGIAVDLFFDHLLAIHWNNYHPTPLRTFTNEFYEHIEDLPDIYPLEFRYVLSKMKHDDWLFQYSSFSGLEMACTGLSARIRFKNDLHKASEVFRIMRAEIEPTFHLYMDDAREYFKIRH